MVRIVTLVGAKAMCMFAIIRTGGKQYRVTPGQSLFVEKLPQADGETCTFSDVLCVSNGDEVHVGEDCQNKAQVTASLVKQVRDNKVIILKKKRRHNYRRKNGHRQPLTLLKIQDIVWDKKSLCTGTKS